MQTRLLAFHWFIPLLLSAIILAHRTDNQNDRPGRTLVGLSKPNSVNSWRPKRQVRAWILKLNPGVTEVCGNSIMCSRGTICLSGECQCPTGSIATASSCLPPATVGQSCYQSTQCAGQSVCNGQLCACPPNAPYTGTASQCAVGPVAPGNYCGTSNICGGGAVCQSQYCYCPAGTSAQNGVCVTLQPNYNYQSLVVPTQAVVKTPGDLCTTGQTCTGGSFCYLGLCCCPASAVVQGGICVTITVSGVLPAVPQVTQECFSAITCKITPECPVGAYCVNNRCCCAQGTMMTDSMCLQPGGVPPRTSPKPPDTGGPTDSGVTDARTTGGGGGTDPPEPPSPPPPTEPPMPMTEPPMPETPPPPPIVTTDLPPTLPPETMPPETERPLPPATIITPIPFPNTSPLPPMPPLPPMTTIPPMPPPIDGGAKCPNGNEPTGKCLGGLCPPGSECINGNCCGTGGGGGEIPSPPGAGTSAVVDGVTPVSRNGLEPITMPDGTMVEPAPGPGILDLDYSPYDPNNNNNNYNIAPLSAFERNYYGISNKAQEARYLQQNRGGRRPGVGNERGLHPPGGGAAPARSRNNNNNNNNNLADRILHQSTASLAQFKSVAKGGGKNRNGQEDYKPLVKVGQHCTSDWDCLGAGMCSPKKQMCACKSTDFQIGLYCLESGTASQIDTEERWRRRKPIGRSLQPDEKN